MSCSFQWEQHNYLCINDSFINFNLSRKKEIMDPNTWWHVNLRNLPRGRFEKDRRHLKKKKKKKDLIVLHGFCLRMYSFKNWMWHKIVCMWMRDRAASSPPRLLWRLHHPNVHKEHLLHFMHLLFNATLCCCCFFCFVFFIIAWTYSWYLHHNSWWVPLCANTYLKKTISIRWTIILLLFIIYLRLQMLKSWVLFQRFIKHWFDLKKEEKRYENERTIFEFGFWALFDSNF